MALSRDGAALRLKDDDHVAVCLRDVAAGTELDFDGGGRVTARIAIPAGHKIALRAIESGELIRKYGQTIGRAGVAIEPGQHVHVHNVEGTRGRGDLPR
ncbi:MAG: UxaA family hydrolase [Candidatus Velthaea sp.]|jgi:altronate dehydratase small subunit